MSRARPDRRPIAALLALGVLVAALVGCSDDAPAPGPDADATAPADVAAAVRAALETRAAAVRDGDAEAFRRTVGGSRAFRAEQQTWYANLTQLPVGRLRYRLDPASLVRDGDGYWVTVTQVLQLDGYDAAPVTSPDRFRFGPVSAAGRARLTSVTDPEWEAAHDVQAQPWDLGRIDVREGFGVLGVFDAGSVGAADAIVASVETGISDVSAWVPYDWSRHVVVYALSDPTFLQGLEDVPGDDPGDLDAVSFPAGEGTRFVLNPRVLGRSEPEVDRLVRHELTHVAVGTHDDAAPVWLSEGLAEWVSVRPIPPEERRLPDSALKAAERGTVRDLPDDRTFNDDDSQAHYGLAWWAVESIANSYGEQAPWTLLDAVSVPGADVGSVVRDQLGLTTRELAQQAVLLILATYAAPGAGLVSPSPT
ncbi:hypothetical protein GON03_20820 [Nocardioides sp. MAH-18]|uniref:Peptidase MA-like domain-containing protein n=1 Tax=Nocardioides agri TaxID=2682843 RepID=A0A6L6XWM2_9ACTN|nr:MULTISPECIES: hypothetical protein [unclassified Nocardioides]MBA2952468.1 hypothetical protein [Nocardioides sp. CGMCC 1.13656]MVQ51630.1 hypothetical protein [Nocardioides sp. MAH-18]